MTETPTAAPASRTRRRNPRVLATTRVREARSATTWATRALERHTSRDVYERPADAPPGTNLTRRPRRPEEHADVRADVYAETIRYLDWARNDLLAARYLCAYRLASLGYDDRGDHVGVIRAMHLLPDDVREWVERELTRPPADA